MAATMSSSGFTSIIGCARMHELSIAESVIESITQRVGDAQVCGIALEIGRLSGVSVDSLRFCFELAAADTVAAGASLDVSEPDGLARCLDCGEEFIVADLILLCRCGSSDVRLLSGDELRIVSVRVRR